MKLKWTARRFIRLKRTALSALIAELYAGPGNPDYDLISFSISLIIASTGSIKGSTWLSPKIK